MKKIKHIKKFNESTENSEDIINVSEVMKQSLNYYEFINIMGEKLSKIISEQIEPLLQEGKYNEAKQMVREFYKPSRYKIGDETEGDVIFIDYDLILFNINRRKNNE